MNIVANRLVSLIEQSINGLRGLILGLVAEDAKEQFGEPTPAPSPPTGPAPTPVPSPKSPPAVVVAAEASVESMRGTAKWIITILAALAGVIIAGTQMTSFGKLDAPDGLDDARLGIAWGTGIAAIIAIGVIIWQAIRVLTVGNAAISDLVEDEAKVKKSDNLTYAYKVGVLETGESIEDFWNKRGEYQSAEQQAKTRLIAAEIAVLREPESKQRAIELSVAKLAAEEATERSATLARRRYILLSALRADIVGRTMKDATLPMVVAGVLGGICLGGFVWAVNPPDGEPEPFLLPAKAIIHLNDDERERYASTLGEECDANEFQGIVMNIEGETAHVVSIGSPDCEIVEMELSTKSISASEAVSVPTQQPAEISSPPVASPSASPSPSPIS